VTLFFLALRETTRLDLENTAIPAAFVRQQLTETAAESQIIFLDSLLGSVVSTETRLHRDSPLNVRLNFCVLNRHQAILAASDYLSFCLAGEHYVAVRSAQPPIAESIVRGLRSRAADEKGDRHVSVNGLLNYLKYAGSARQDEMRVGWTSEAAGESDEYRDIVDNRFSIVLEDEITLIPEVPGIRFNPPRRSFSWATGLRMHAESFFIYAPFSLIDQSVRGRISVFFKQLLFAEIALDLRVAKDLAPKEEGWAKEADQRFRKVFPSYSNHDVEVVEAIEQLQTIGSEYLRKVVKMRSDQQWDEGLPATIADADVFQLFWSGNAAQSAQVEKEWRHAITLQRVAFVRPVYWEIPMGEAPEPLRRLRFCFLPGIHPMTDRRKDAVWEGAPVEDQRSSVDRPEISDVAPQGMKLKLVKRLIHRHPLWPRCQHRLVQQRLSGEKSFQESPYWERWSVAVS
jgi:hypothetical protein